MHIIKGGRENLNKMLSCQESERGELERRGRFAHGIVHGGMDDGDEEENKKRKRLRVNELPGVTNMPPK